MTGMRTVKIGVPVALAIVAASIVGLKAYSASRGEDALRNWLFEHDLQDQVSWRSLSASPLGGSLTLHDVVLSGAGLTVETVELSNVHDERDSNSADIRLSGVVSDIDSERPVGIVSLLDFDTLMHSSGLRKLKPFDVRMQWDYQREEQTVRADFEADLPEMLRIKASLGLNQAKELVEAYSDASDKYGMPSSPLGMGFALMGLLGDKDAGRVELNHLRFEIKDNGYFKRSALLSKRYRFVPGPQSDDWDADREAAFTASMEKHTRACQKEFRDAGKQAREGCEAYTELVSARSEGMSLSFEPDERVRLAELAKVFEHRNRLGPLTERLNLKIDTL
ncbi:hypothetical protein IQ22_01087 [Pseudomonas duriflava]|uniref:Uncharacterized protein n=1 Tax=Pseudomonas duriflava TaxID=459528 RepID=A0A562QIU0_9PSED|nr:hypothetical protein [Pseudomonas duriflava]TWI56635.1 hypothetical protein IQ22_01087 [Pseudomonas duriflava]